VAAHLVWSHGAVQLAQRSYAKCSAAGLCSFAEELYDKAAGRRSSDPNALKRQILQAFGLPDTSPAGGQ
jgi:hypothetical protein